MMMFNGLGFGAAPVAPAKQTLATTIALCPVEARCQGVAFGDTCGDGRSIQGVDCVDTTFIAADTGFSTTTLAMVAGAAALVGGLLTSLFLHKK